MTDALALIDEHQPAIDRELEHLRSLYNAYHGEVTSPYIPRSANHEFRTLLERSKINVLPLVVAAASQSLHVEDYRTRGNQDEGLGARIFEKNALGSRQAALFDAALMYGYAYTSVVPGDELPYIGLYSPRRMYALYETPGEDEYPEYAFQLGARGHVTAVWDDETIQRIAWTKDPDTLRRKPTVTSTETHNVGVCPIQRHVVAMDLEGRAKGEVEGLYALQVRLNQIAFDELIAISYNSFKVRGFTGLAPELDENGNPVPINADAARMFLISDPDTKPFQLDGTDLKGYLDAVDQVIKQIAAVSQTPVHVLQGSMSNLSAEALAAAESGLMRKLGRYQHRLGESLESMLRLAIAVAGGADDDASEVIWADSESRTLSNVSDALVKLAAGLEIPAEGLWGRIPNVTQGELDLWSRLKAEDPAQKLLAMTDEQKQQMPDVGGGTADGGSATDDLSAKPASGPRNGRTSGTAQAYSTPAGR